MKRTLSLLALVGGALAAIALLWPRSGPRSHGQFPQDVYVWQRAWGVAVANALGERATHFSSVVALKAEVNWRNKQPRVVEVELDYPTLRQTGRPVGLALRIGPFAGPFQPTDARTSWLAELAASILREASTNELRLAELQIDFDCPESKLDGYRVWVEAIRRRVAPVPVTITALPAWLDRSACRRLVAASDGFVLQVHSLARPRDASSPFQLCDPAAARRAVERAGRFGQPFRVALPTYGYRVGFHPSGQFAGLSAEGPGRIWPDASRLREVRADPEEMAGLVVAWQEDRPAWLRGVIWYRLPVAGDTLNWSWPTLAAAMKGEAPRPDLRIEARHPQPELVELELVNNGRAAAASPARVTLTWSEARFVAGDGVQGYELSETGGKGARFDAVAHTPRLEAGQRRIVGWIRLSRATDVKVQMQLNED